jgi:hypothetical protein
MASGNPAKRAQQVTIAEVRRAVEQGRHPVVVPFPGTEIVIRTKNPDDAEYLVRTLVPAPAGGVDVSGSLLGMQAALANLSVENPYAVFGWLVDMFDDFSADRDETPEVRRWKRYKKPIERFEEYVSLCHLHRRNRVEAWRNGEEDPCDMCQAGVSNE